MIKFPRPLTCICMISCHEKSWNRHVCIQSFLIVSMQYKGIFKVLELVPQVLLGVLENRRTSCHPLFLPNFNNLALWRQSNSVKHHPEVVHSYTGQGGENKKFCTASLKMWTCKNEGHQPPPQTLVGPNHNIVCQSKDHEKTNPYKQIDTFLLLGDATEVAMAAWVVRGVCQIRSRFWPNFKSAGTTLLITWWGTVRTYSDLKWSWWRLRITRWRFWRSKKMQCTSRDPFDSHPQSDDKLDFLTLPDLQLITLEVIAKIW